jgi:hypothetical protein
MGFKMMSSGGIFRTNSLPKEGDYHGQIFEYLKDNISNPELYSWNELQKKWIPMSGGGNVTYKNSNPMPVAVGGFSVGTNFTEEKTIQEMLDGLLYPYIPPSISLGTTISTIQELGTSLPSIQLNATMAKKSNDITKVEYYKNGSLVYLKDNPSLSESYIDSTGINSDTTYSVKVYDDKPNSVSRSFSFNYIYPMYIGNVDDLNPTETNIKGITKKLIVKSNQTLDYTISNSRFCFACPSSYGSLTSIKDPNNFELLNTFNIINMNFTMLDNKSIPYIIYISSVLTTQSNFTITYNF